MNTNLPSKRILASNTCQIIMIVFQEDWSNILKSTIKVPKQLASKHPSTLQCYVKWHKRSLRPSFTCIFRHSSAVFAWAILDHIRYMRSVPYMYTKLSKLLYILYWIKQCFAVPQSTYIHCTLKMFLPNYKLMIKY